MTIIICKTEFGIMVANRRYYAWPILALLIHYSCLLFPWKRSIKLIGQKSKGRKNMYAIEKNKTITLQLILF